MDFLLPDIPEEVVALRELENRIGQVIDWAYDENTRASHRRSHELGLAMQVEDYRSRQFVFLKIDKRYFARLREIEETVEAYTLAYREAKNAINLEPLLDHAIQMMPIVTLAGKELVKLRAQQKLDMINERSKLNEEKKAKRKLKKVSREMTSGKNDSGDRLLSETDRKEETSNEGSGDRAIPEDRGLSNQ